MATPPDARPSHIPYPRRSSCSAPSGSTASASDAEAIAASRKTMAQLADIKANEALLACAVGDLPWLKRAIAGGSRPCATNREVAKIVKWRY